MKRLVITLIAVFAACLVGPGAARAGTTMWVVDNDRMDCPRADFTSVQAAVTAASPGDTILVCEGTYHERVLIAKNDLTLRAKGAPSDVVVDADNLGHALHISGASGVTIEGFMVQHGHDNDIQLTNASRNTIRKNLLTAAHHDGIELLNADDNLIEQNVSFDNFGANACGINLSAGSERNLVRHNTVRNNEWGIQIFGSNDNVIFDNEAVGNRGNGIRNVVGSSRTVIDGNRVFHNGFTPHPVLTDGTNGGIRLATGTGLVVERNHAFDNLAVDIRQEAAVATFENNHCNTSLPPGICEHDEGNGH
jgi:parallel beta-helix repeat protein